MARLELDLESSYAHDDILKYILRLSNSDSRPDNDRAVSLFDKLLEPYLRHYTPSDRAIAVKSAQTALIWTGDRTRDWYDHLDFNHPLRVAVSIMSDSRPIHLVSSGFLHDSLESRLQTFSYGSKAEGERTAIDEFSYFLRNQIVEDLWLRERASFGYVSSVIDKVIPTVKAVTGLRYITRNAQLSHLVEKTDKAILPYCLEIEIYDRDDNVLEMKHLRRKMFEEAEGIIANPTLDDVLYGDPKLVSRSYRYNMARSPIPAKWLKQPERVLKSFLKSFLLCHFVRHPAVDLGEDFQHVKSKESDLLKHVIIGAAIHINRIIPMVAPKDIRKLYKSYEVYKRQDGFSSIDMPHWRKPFAGMSVNYINKLLTKDETLYNELRKRWDLQLLLDVGLMEMCRKYAENPDFRYETIDRNGVSAPYTIRQPL